VPLLQTALIALAQYDAAHRIAHVLKSAADVCRNSSTGILRKVADGTLAYTVHCDFGWLQRKKFIAARSPGILVVIRWSLAPSPSPGRNFIRPD